MSEGRRAAGASNFSRREWDKEEYERRATERREKEDGGDDADRPVGPDGRKAPAPYRDAPAGYAGPSGSSRAYLKARDYEVDIDSKLNKKRLVTESTPVSQTGGFWCELCQCTLRDSGTYLSHINGEKHQRRMGFSMRVERVGVESVKAKLEALKKAATATSHTGSHSSRTAGGTSELDAEDREAMRAMSVKRSGGVSIRHRDAGTGDSESGGEGDEEEEGQGQDRGKGSGSGSGAPAAKRPRHTEAVDEDTEDTARTHGPSPQATRGSSSIPTVAYTGSHSSGNSGPSASTNTGGVVVANKQAAVVSGGNGADDDAEAEMAALMGFGAFGGGVKGKR